MMPLKNQLKKYLSILQVFPKIQSKRLQLKPNLQTNQYTMSTQANRIQQNYDQKAINNSDHALKRQQRNLFESNSFNNWIKSVLMNVYCQDMCKRVEKELDLPKGDRYNKLLHVLDIGCGRGQDILKWRLGRVNYMMATDFSSECIKEYEKRWNELNQPYRLYTAVEDFTKQDLYFKVDHSYYDMVSAQFCFHYMFGTEKGLKTGLNSIFSNLLIDGVFIATIPDSYTILKKVHQKGIKQKDGSTVYGNQYFSIRFKNTKFNQPFGNIYEFYLEEAVGKKDPETGEIEYVEEWLIPLDELEKLLEQNGVVIETTMNFLEFYLKYREQYKDLFAKFKLNYEPEQHMHSDIWEIGHLYRVLVCRKVSKGKRIGEFGLDKRRQAARKQIPREEKNFDRNKSNNKFQGREDRSRDDRYRSHGKHEGNNNYRKDNYHQKGNRHN